MSRFGRRHRAPVDASSRYPTAGARRAAARGHRHQDPVRDLAGPRACRRRRQLLARAGQDARHRRRVGLGQVGALAVDHGPAAEEQRGALGQHPLRGSRDHRPLGRRPAGAVGHADGDGVPGPDDVAEPGDEDRQPDHRAAAVPPRHLEELRQGDRGLAPRFGRDPRARAPRQAVPARDVGRHAPAGDDRDRDRLRPQAALRRRADDRARRDRAGPDPRPAPGRNNASASWP